jgi:hypothetical protein
MCPQLKSANRDFTDYNADARGEMQRRLMLMRHAKSSWKSQVPTDHERPLNERGRRDAARVGKRLSKLG